MSLFLSQAEREFHRRHDNLVTLAQCFKANIGPHFAIRKAIGQEKKYAADLTTWQKVKIWSIIFLLSLLPFTLYSVDVSTDGILVKKYDSDRDDSHVNLACEGLKYDLNNDCSLDSSKLKLLAEIPSELSTEACFNYSLAFIIFPIISFALEWYSDQRKQLKIKVDVFMN